MNLINISPLWKEYELIDSGNFEKLERFGEFILARPEPQAMWDKIMSENEWNQMSHANFRRDEKNPEKGLWTLKSQMKEQWPISYSFNNLQLNFRLGLSSFKHVGLFPEQADNWNYIYQKTSSFDKPKVLNLFAYTGGASLAAKAAGADITHLDSVKQCISWAKENMEASKLDNIRWLVEDAFKYVKREAKRGTKYQGIILDPPAYGRGPEGEKWVLEDCLNETLKYCANILDEKGFLVLNLYSMGYSALQAETLIKSVFGNKKVEIGEFYFEDKSKRKLPLGLFARF
ncbi:MAG: class I SAM-dependent methyltransferase [Opitutaceae bacterium]|nr:class I SAM-dependent methyltransferase [Cytophagales bacterium]